MHYARNSYVAMIDRTLLPNVKIYHVPDLHNAGLVEREKDWEYLMYGPVDGPGLRCVACKDIENAQYYELAGESTGEALFNMSVYTHVERKVARAKELARLFCPAIGEHPDVVVALTAAFSCLDWGYIHKGRKGIFSINLSRALIAGLRDELKRTSKKTALVNPKMYAGGHFYPQVGQSVFQLRNLEEWIRTESEASEALIDAS